MKSGGNAYKLFEFLKDRGESAAPKPSEQQQRTLKFDHLAQSESKPRPTLLIGGIDEKPAARKSFVQVADTDVPAATVPQAAREKPAEHTERRQSVVGHYRGKALVVKYDIAMVAFLALLSLLVIAYVWGYYFGKSAGMKAAKDEAAIVSERVKTAGPVVVPYAGPPTRLSDDGRGPYRLQLCTSKEIYIKDLAANLKGKNYPNVAVEQAGANWVLYLGLFENRDKAEKYLKYLQDEEKGDTKTASDIKGAKVVFR